MAPFDRPYATFYTSAIVNIALSRVRVRVMVRVSLSNLHVLTKSILSNRFFTHFTHSQPVYFNETFIVSGKSPCCNGTFTNVIFTLLVTTSNEKTK